MLGSFKLDLYFPNFNAKVLCKSKGRQKHLFSAKKVHLITEVVYNNVPRVSLFSASSSMEPEKRDPGNEFGSDTGQQSKSDSAVSDTKVNILGFNLL